MNLNYFPIPILANILGPPWLLFFGYDCDQADKKTDLIRTCFLTCQWASARRNPEMIKVWTAERRNGRSKQAWIIQRRENMFLIGDRAVEFCISLFCSDLWFHVKTGYSFRGKWMFHDFQILSQLKKWVTTVTI